MEEHNLKRQAAKKFIVGDIVEKEDGSPFEDPFSLEKYPRAKIVGKTDEMMTVKPVDESGKVVEGRYNYIYIQSAEYSSLKITAPFNSRNLRRRRNEEDAAYAAAKAAAEAAELELERALLATFRVGQLVGYSVKEYDYQMESVRGVLGTYRVPATILEIIPGSPSRAQIRYDTADSQPPVPSWKSWIDQGVVTKIVFLKELGQPPQFFAASDTHFGHDPVTTNETAIRGMNWLHDASGAQWPAALGGGPRVASRRPRRRAAGCTRKSKGSKRKTSRRRRRSAIESQDSSCKTHLRSGAQTN
jgi:hypothetical protein